MTGIKLLERKLVFLQNQNEIELYSEKFKITSFSCQKKYILFEVKFQRRKKFKNIYQKDDFERKVIGK